MATREWTDKQRQSIDARGGTLLIAAAAGSGKTAVLVERVLRLITDEENPVDIRRLLIVTFTRAAAAEMRARLRVALTEKMAADPHNPLYQQQQMLLPQAHISTVHGFCADLLRQYAAEAGLPARMRVAEGNETALLSSEALDTVLEESYRRRDPAFLAFAAQLGDRKNDNRLREAILQAYDFMQAQPFPDRWLTAQADAYTAVCAVEDTPWFAPLRREVCYTLENGYQLARRVERLCEHPDLENYRAGVTVDRQAIERLLQQVPTCRCDELAAQLDAFALERLRPVKTEDPTALQIKKEISSTRERLRRQIKAIKSKFIYSADEHRRDLDAMAPIIDALGTLVRSYTAEFTRLKRQKKLLDYNDLEHECIRLLLNAESGEPTPLAREISARFDHIMVDEYQDTNAAQDALFEAISREGDNLFMVGDVKQSIYGFRQAMPAVFTARRDAYAVYSPDVPTYPAAIMLENNFRSRHSVTDTVNFLFRQLMHRSLGGVEYDEREALVCSARYDDAPHDHAEWMLIDHADSDGTMGIDTAEIHAIARRIRELMGSMTVGQGDGVRPLAYSDICVLMRTRAAAERYARELTALGIPAGAQSGGSIADTPEITTALALLRVIDNPLQEISLTAVMMSPLYGFSADECGRVRLTADGLPLYTAIEQYPRRDDADPTLAAKCAALIADLRRARTMAVSMPADRLIERLYRDTGLVDIFAARHGGSQRVANLHQLDRMARTFEQDGFRGLSAFIRYIDRLLENGTPLAGGDTIQQDGVRVLTVHASKGLEFPVVFLARLYSKWNNEDSRQKLLFHQQVGIGLRLRDDETERRTLPFDGVLAAKRQDDRAEELRVWYVALTRAREKLITVISSHHLTQQLARLEGLISPDTALPSGVVMRADSTADWMLLAALRHPSFAALRQDPQHTISLAVDAEWRVSVLTPTVYTPDEQPLDTAAATADDALCATLRERAAYVYPHAALAGVPAKLAAGALSHAAMHRAHIATARPAFLQSEGMTAAQKGTALHTYMQYADYVAAAADPIAEADRLERDGYITTRQRQALAADKIAAFFASPLYARMAASPDCRREYHLTVTVPAATIDPAVTSDDMVVVQGIADCVFREGDHLVLVDYKTDRVGSAEELADRYRSQLTFYKQALEQILELPVTEAILYSFHLGREVAVDIR